MRDLTEKEKLYLHHIVGSIVARTYKVEQKRKLNGDKYNKSFDKH